MKLLANGWLVTFWEVMIPHSTGRALGLHRGGDN